MNKFFIVVRYIWATIFYLIVQKILILYCNLYNIYGILLKE